jgi:tetratricopeptide (TPR) repeat protein
MIGPENNPLAKNWLVKSSTKILGPFTREEVLNLLTHRQITIIDEIRQPEGRWNYIRENRHFKEIVKNLRYEDDHSREDTMTSTMTSAALQATQTMTITKTENSEAEEFTVTPLVPPKAPPGANATIKDVTPTPESEALAASRAVARAAAGTKRFGNLQDQRVQNKIQKQNVFLRTILLGIVACAALFLVYNYTRKDRRSDQGYTQLLASALRYKELGLYERALESYKKAAAIKEPDLESQFQMAFLLISQDRQSLIGRRIIERASLKEGRSRNDIIQGHLGIALSYMMEGDFSQADTHFQKALSFDGNNTAAKFNQATILFKKGNFAQALEGYEALSSPTSSLYPVVLLYRAMALVELTNSASSTEPTPTPAVQATPSESVSLLPDTSGGENLDLPPAQLERQYKLIREIKGFTQKSHFLRKELLLMLSYLGQMSKDSATMQSSMQLFLEEPYNFSSFFVKDPTLDWRNAEWDYLEKYCNEFYNADPTAANMKPVRAVCLLESNRDMEATKFIDEALAADPKKPSSLKAQAVYLWKLGRVGEAKLLLQNSELKQDRLALYIIGDACTNAKDIPCAETAYNRLDKKDPTDVIPSFGMARLKVQQKDKIQAMGFIKTGLERESNFIPLIELREKLEFL